MKKYIVLIIILLTTEFAFAQWSSNPMVNTKVCDTTGEQSNSKIAITSDGGCYIGWFDTRNGNYAVYLQKLNAQGIKQFPESGLLVSNNPQNTYIVDWSLAVDDSNCCVLTFCDIRAGGAFNPYAYRINTTGQFLWGANGIALTDSINVFQANPKVIVTSDGNFVFTWQYNNSLALQKLNKAGAKLWGTTPYLVNGNPAINEKFNYPTSVGSDNGSIILYWIGYTGSFISPSNFKTYTQKFSSAGTRLWGNPQDTIYSLGSAQGTYQPSIYSDGNNGAIYVWQSYIAGPTNCYVQRKNSSGQILFPVNGSTVGVVNTSLRFAPAAVYMPSTNETYLFWQQKNSLQSAIGVYGQKFSGTGTRLWADTGVAFKPLDANSFSSLSACSRDTSVMAYYCEILTGSTNGLIKAFKIKRDGTFLWGGGIITPSSIASDKSKLATVLNPVGTSILTWTDARNDAGGIYVQNINYDGTFGIPVGIWKYENSIPEEYSLKQNYPNPFNPSTKIRYEIPKDGFVNLKVFNALGQEVATLINQFENAGKYEIIFSADNFHISSGIYFYKLSVNGFEFTKQMVLLK